eukprot:2761686-Amphidinium_carterae.1
MAGCDFSTFASSLFFLPWPLATSLVLLFSSSLLSLSRSILSASLVASACSFTFRASSAFTALSDLRVVLPLPCPVLIESLDRHTPNSTPAGRLSFGWFGELMPSVYWHSLVEGFAVRK